MVKLVANKHYTKGIPIETLSAGKHVFVPLSKHIGRPAIPTVKVGDTVKVGQKIGEKDGFISSNIHSPVSGKVKSIEWGRHPSSGRSQGIWIENDGSDDIAYERRFSSLEKVLQVAPKDLVDIICEGGIVGLGGAGFPTYVKLSPKKEVDTLVVNMAECEPYITSDYRLFLEEMDKVFAGIKIVMYILKVKNAIIGIESHNHDLIEQAIKYIDKNKLTGISVKDLPSTYPQGAEKTLIKTVLNREVPLGGLPLDVGVVVQNVATLYAIYEVIMEGKPLFERVITVSGAAVSRQRHFRVRIGMMFSEVIEKCGGLKDDVVKVIAGGPMMGVSVPHLDVPIVKTTGAILALGRDETYIGDEWECCIRCGRCVDNCPMGLMPADISLAMEADNIEIAKEWGLMDCIECGSCSYVCPAKRPIVQWIKRGKMEVRRQMAKEK